MKRQLLLLAFIFTLGTTFTSCRDMENDNPDDVRLENHDEEMEEDEMQMNEENDLDEVEQDLENAAEDTGEAIENAAEETGNAVENAGNEVEEELNGTDDY
ncbi:hypothetical protein [Autumnicola musiva]|uniref:Uncharacterized protein n=1 Tax=Autumnicola musiva TaxID=3075589 RepID=A0ABU3D6Y2_9FLAO|nr:hypothetical protein [Zunongwangia sp. F117]MDT0677134.1 hypothetical protein [Zunongwangia sp. F117]